MALVRNNEFWWYFLSRKAHAPEIIEENGEYYITTCGWLDKSLPHKGAVSIAKLVWEEK